VMALLREREIVLEVCPSSNLNTAVVRDLAEVRRIIRLLLEHRVRIAISTDGPEMLRSTLRNELNLLLRTEIMSLDEVRQAIATARAASFVDRAPIVEPTPLPLDGHASEHAAIGIGARS
jgi:adenosine deaminase